ncbi:MAG: NUDIX hydrolase [Pseudomonadota bacterium]
MAARTADTSNKPVVRAQPAASLIALWVGSGEQRVLMGRRNPDLAFLPNVMVFPGGRLEARDRQSVAELSPHAHDRLSQEIGARGNPFRFAACAIRETNEEAGFDLARCLAGSLSYVARAITPARFPKRYDTRFLLARIEDGWSPRSSPGGDGELLDVGWYAPGDLDRSEMHHVTRAIYDQVMTAGFSRDEAPILIADRTPRNWHGRPALRSKDLRT